MPGNKKRRRKPTPPKDVRRARERRAFMEEALPLVEKVQVAEAEVRRAPDDPAARERLNRARQRLSAQVRGGGLSPELVARLAGRPVGGVPRAAAAREGT